jgi:uncharacterized protein (DUF488 family)
MTSHAGEILTIGHSTHALERFISLLSNARVTAVADVRTSPYSRYHSHFNREDLKEALRLHKISYVFLGRELGGRPSSKRLYCEGIADYEKMAKEQDFDKALKRVCDGAKKYRIALMCAERDPLDCHRCLLVSRSLAERGMAVRHILDNGNMLSQAEIESELLKLSGRNFEDFFAQHSERLAVAYREQARKVAFAEPQIDEIRRPAEKHT